MIGIYLIGVRVGRTYDDVVSGSLVLRGIRLIGARVGRTYDDDV